MKTVLVISAHIDDAECGCGGSIIRHLEEGDRVFWHTMIGNGYRMPSGWDPDTLVYEFQEAMFLIGVDDYVLHEFDLDITEAQRHPLRDRIYHLWQEIDPDVAYVPWSGSRHQDHATVGTCAEQVSWRTKATVLEYVVVNDYIGFVPNTFSVLTESHFAKKIEMLQCYASQFTLRPWFTSALIADHAKAFSIFGNSNGNEYVEPFFQARRVNALEGDR